MRNRLKSWAGFIGLALAIVFVLSLIPADVVIIGDGVLSIDLSETTAQGDWVINGSKVYVDDENVYLSANPHTLEGSGWVEFELNSKVWSGEVDVVWGIPSGLGITPSQPQRWALNVSHEKQRDIIVSHPYTLHVCNISEWAALSWNGLSPDIGNFNNTHIYNVTASDWRCTGNSTNSTTYLIAFNSYDGNMAHATVYGNRNVTEQETYYEYYDDWVSWGSPPMQTVNYTYAGVDQWRVVQLDTAIQAGKTYKVRCWIDEPIQLGDFTYKYVWAIKPRTQSIQEARQAGNLYILDPWLSGGWDQRVKLTTDNTDVDSALSNFPILLYISTSSGRNNDDVSFVFDELQSDANRKKIAVTTSDGETQCYVEIEEWDDASEEAWLHGKAPSVSNSADTDFYLYYDADHADNTAYVGDSADGSAATHAVWDSNFKAVYHMNSASNAQLVDSTDQNNDTDANTLDTVAGQIGLGMNSDGSEIATINDNASLSALSSITAEVWMESSDTTGLGALIGKYSTGNKEWLLEAFPNADRLECVIYDESATAVIGRKKDNATIFDNSWHHLVMVWDGGTTDSNVKSYKDGVQIDDTNVGSGTFVAIEDKAAPTEIGGNAAIGWYSEWDLDEVRISEAERNVAWVKATYETGRDDLLDWGSEESAVIPPTVTTSAATNVEDTTATLNGEVTALGDTAIIERGFAWDTSTKSEPDEDTAPSGSGYANYWTEEGSWGTGTFNHGVTSLQTATTHYYRAAAENNDNKWGWGAEQTFLTKPAAPANVAATDGVHTNKVVVTWTQSSGTVTGYKIYENDNLLDTVGDVATWDDTTVPAPTITPGTASASDGSSTAHVELSVSGESANNGATRTYKVRAYNDSGDSADSGTDTGYRGVGSLTYQWYRSAVDSDANYSTIAGGTTDPYNDMAAPQGTITPGSSGASDGSSPLHTILTVIGESTSDGAGRYYLCELSATGAASQNSTTNRGYRTVGALSYQWMRSAADSDAGYSNISGGTSDPYNDTASPAPTITGGNASASDGTSSSYVTLTASNETGNNGDGRYFLSTLSADGATSQNSTSNRGYRGTTTLTYQWMRSAADSDADYSNISGGTTDPYNDTGGVVDPDGRYYQALVSMSGASSQNSTSDRGYKASVSEPTVASSNATGVSTTGATLHGNVTDTGGASVTMRGFEWGYATGNYTLSWNETSADFGLGAFAHTIGSLNTCDEVFWRAFAVNSEGTGNSSELSFNTSCALLAPTDFEVTQTGASTANITWTMGVGAVRTIIRGSESGYPETVTDGYSTYNGTGTWVEVEGLSFQSTTYYYRAWSEDGSISEDYAQGSIGGAAMLLILFGILGLGLTYGFFWKHSPFFAYGAAGAWALLAFQSFQQSASASPVQITDTYMALFWLCVAFVIGCVLLPTVMREKRSPDDIYPEEVDEVTGEPIPKEEKEAFNPKRLISNFRRRRASKFARTGQE